MRILMLEDRPEDADLICRALKKDGVEFDFHLVDTEQGFVQGLEEYHPDIVLSDHSLPTFNSQLALKICSEIAPDIPFILVTGTVSEEFAVKILKLGADDYILKSNLTRLSSAVFLAIKQRKLILEKRNVEKLLCDRNLELTKLLKERDKFIYSISHDIKAPLSSISGLINLIFLHFNKKQPIDEFLVKLQSCIEKLNSNIREMQSYFSNTSLEVTYKKIDIDKLLKECLRKVENIEGYSEIERNISVEFKRAICSDEYRLTLIIDNLIANAIKYRDHCKPESHFDLKIVVADTIKILYADNGIGIRKENLGKIFEMHFRDVIDNKGTGIGLYIVKEAIEKLGGFIKVDSEFTTGTKIIIEIPNKY